MPVSNRLLRRLGAVLAVSALAASAAPGASAAAAVPCGARALSTPFAPWGDHNSYFLAANGGFEAGLNGFIASGGAGIVAGNEPFAVNGRGTHSASIPAGGSITTQPYCLLGSENRIRLFVRAPGTAGSALRVEMTRRIGGAITTSTVLTVRSGTPSGWYTPAAATLWAQPAPTSTVTLRFATAGAATWQIDDLYIDPWKCC